MEKELKMKELRVYAEEIRVKTLEVFSHLGFGHVGGAMSVVETVAVLYGSMMRYDPKNPAWPDRDKLVMSKGHAGPTLYATLAMKGFFPEAMLRELNQGGGRLPSHCDRNKTPGIDMTTGSLGQGISAAIGIALGDRMDGRDSMTYAILGDGELDEGQNWEGFMFANHYKLSNLVVFVDANGQQLDGYTKDVMDTDSISEKIKAFGWLTYDIDGHDIAQIYDAVAAAKAQNEKPTAIVLRTKKGHGCTFAEGILSNHHINFTAEQMEEALSHARAVLAEAKNM
ncbi:MAG: transketolase [Clostridiales bacterium]|nr:transketolase [Clostridiales bacterium]